jgi:hypothetical protein
MKNLKSYQQTTHSFPMHNAQPFNEEIFKGAQRKGLQLEA